MKKTLLVFGVIATASLQIAHGTLAGLHHALEPPALVKKIIEAERTGYDAVVQSNTNFGVAI